MLFTNMLHVALSLFYFCDRHFLLWKILEYSFSVFFLSGIIFDFSFFLEQFRKSKNKKEASTLYNTSSRSGCRAQLEYLWSSKLYKLWKRKIQSKHRIHFFISMSNMWKRNIFRIRSKWMHRLSSWSISRKWWPK